MPRKDSSMKRGNSLSRLWNRLRSKSTKTRRGRTEDREESTTRARSSSLGRLRKNLSRSLSSLRSLGRKRSRSLSSGVYHPDEQDLDDSQDGAVVGGLAPEQLEKGISQIAQQRSDLEQWDLEREVSRDRDLGPLPPGWEIRYTSSGEECFFNRDTQMTHMIDPRIERLASQSESDLPFGWDVVRDREHGTYYIDHLNKRTTYIDPRGSNSRSRSLGSKSPSPRKSASLRSARLPARSPSVTSRKEKHVHLTHEVKRPVEGGFGFTVAGMYPEKMLIHTVFKTSPAYGKLQPGDHLLAVNGVDTKHLTHEMLVDLLSRVPRGELVLFSIERTMDVEDGSSTHSEQQRVGTEPARLKLTIQRPPSGTYGFAITYDEATDCYRVSHLKSGSVVDNEGLVRIGDKIVKVNGRDVSNCDHTEVVELVRQFPDHVRLVLERDLEAKIEQQSYEVADLRHLISVTTRTLRDDLIVYDQHRRLALARYGHVRDSYEQAALADSRDDLMRLYPDLTKAAVHIQLLNQRSKAYLAHVTHLESIGSKLALEPYESILQQESQTLTERKAALTSIQRQRMQLVQEYQRALRHTPKCIAVASRVEIVTFQRLSGSFGFTVVGGYGSSVPPMVGKVLPNSAALHADLRVGDQILKINNEDVGSLSHQEVIDRIKASPERIVLTISRSFETRSDFGFPEPYTPFVQDFEDLLSIIEESETCKFFLEIESMLVRDLTIALNKQTRTRDWWFRHDTQHGFIMRLIMDQKRFDSLFPSS
ncbi:hypothetical protein PTSG_02471 [Salpingoeca rosetta]|uniref:Uncharacterized protein n=1 Tax=Salpingoeca rosetta (strain ATCC 50818 / BSB-021) TaxID=946362 RepID=F2U2A7_SALR5|nr:uncharacterized protein PTSG_02471 [Salpingoeca rosetta]EGD81759.1 hypothetical protein PTSG_02471 [Salpingoeca rosetta]|eukprot:XP_004996963.1 hypothetical protein PTSG_02471 [Salpingoeca rosetta]